MSPTRIPCTTGFVQRPLFTGTLSCVDVPHELRRCAAALADPRLTTKNFPFDVSQLPPGVQDDLAPLVRVMKREVLYNDAPDTTGCDGP